jgi:hypothetical protein
LIPASVEFLGKLCFSNARLQGLSFEPESELAQIGDFCFQQSVLKSLSIPQSFQTLGKSWFSACTIEQLTFEPPSRLRRIEESCFAGSSLSLVCLPASLEVLGESCFQGATITSLTCQSDSHLTRIEDSCFANSAIISVVVPRSVAVVGKWCFASCGSEQSPRGVVTFERGSRLRTLEEGCFSRCALKAVSVPRSVETLEASCFEEAKVDIINFEPESTLHCVEERCFAGCLTHDCVLPPSVTIAAITAYDNGTRSFAVLIADAREILRRADADVGKVVTCTEYAVLMRGKDRAEGLIRIVQDTETTKFEIVMRNRTCRVVLLKQVVAGEISVKDGVARCPARRGTEGFNLSFPESGSLQTFTNAYRAALMANKLVQ